MRLLADPITLSETFEDLILNCEKIYFATAWATDKHSVFNVLVEHAYKINLAVVGLHFYQTSPKFIENFMKQYNETDTEFHQISGQTEQESE